MLEKIYLTNSFSFVILDTITLKQGHLKFLLFVPFTINSRKITQKLVTYFCAP